MHHLRVFMEAGADAVAAEFTHHRIAGFFRVLLDDMADVAESCPRAHLGNAQPHAFEGDLAQAARLDRHFANLIHAAGVAVIAILDDRHVDVEDVAVLQLALAGDAVADLMVERDAGGFRIGGVTRWCVIQRGRNTALDIDHVVQTALVELCGRDPLLDERRDVIEDFGSQPAGHAHFLDFFGSLVSDVHDSLGCRKRAEGEG